VGPDDSTRGLGVSSRLNEIRDALGLDGGSHDENQKAALPKVEQWLLGGTSEPAIAVSAAQLLMVDGELTSVAVSQAAAPLRKLLDDEWGNLAEPAERILALKALVLSARDEATPMTEGDRAFALAGSAWRALPQRQIKLHSLINQWLNAAALPNQTVGVTDWDPPDSLKRAVPGLNEKGIKGSIAALKQEMATSALSAEAQEKLLASLAPLADVRSVVEALRAAMMLWAPLVDETVQDAASQADLLWWGQARYCSHRGLPLRQIGGDGAKRWWAAFEVAEFARAGQVEPTASFVVETLATLGLDPSETRPLSDWLQELDLVFREEGARVPRLRVKTAEHVAQCAVGLPVIWLRAQESASFNPIALAEATALDLALSIPSWQWTSWLVREAMLERLIG
jgi:hypothetical protein